MLPALARHAIEVYTAPGELVLDPMCGIGTTLIEAAYTGRDAVGIEYEPRWAALAAAGLTHATTTGAAGRGQVITGDARTTATRLAGQYAGRISLLLTSPPYGRSVHGRVQAPGTSKVRKWNRAYSHDPANLAHQPLQALLGGFTDILTACHPLLRPGGILAITARPWRHHGLLTDFPSAVLHAATTAGYQPLQRCIALLAAVRDGHLVTRASFFQTHETRAARTNGHPLHLIAHEDVLILRKPPPHPTSPETPAGARAGRRADQPGRPT